MSFFAPVSTPVLAEGYTPVLRRAFDHARRVGNYALVQVAVQLLALTSGILLVRWLPVCEYASAYSFDRPHSLSTCSSSYADIPRHRDHSRPLSDRST